MKTKHKGVKPPRNFIAYYSLCDAISGQIEDVSKSIGASGVHAPVFHSQMVSDLQLLKVFCDRAIEALNAAQAEWEKQ